MVEDESEQMERYVRKIVREELGKVGKEEVKIVEEKGIDVHIFNLPKTIKRVTLILDDVSKEVT